MQKTQCVEAELRGPRSQAGAWERDQLIRETAQSCEAERATLGPTRAGQIYPNGVAQGGI